MSTKAQRGTKRTCQNTECGSRFYDLNKDPILCPICGSVFAPSVSAAAMAAASAGVDEKASRKAAKKPAFAPAEAAKTAPEDVDAEDVVIEGEEEEAAGGEDDETFLEEEEEDGPDVTGIIGGPVADNEESS